MRRKANALLRGCKRIDCISDARSAGIDMQRHVPVLLTAVLDLLVQCPGERVLDVTVGTGAHAAAFFERIGPSGTLIGLDADPANLAIARETLRSLQPPVELRHGNFRDLLSLGIAPVDVLFADLGMSSPHVDDPSRGFTFRSDAPLDLRYDRTQGVSCTTRIAHASARELTEVLRTFGQFPGAHRIARLLAASPPLRTTDVVDAARRAYGYRAPMLLPQIFQALRIWVNDELGALAQMLDTIPKMLRPGGRCGILSYHSLEDRLVKHAFRRFAQAPRDPITGRITTPPAFRVLTPRPLRPSPEETADNPRARSARLRALMRITPIVL